jgi:hypothetical protein
LADNSGGKVKVKGDCIVIVAALLAMTGGQVIAHHGDF